MVEMCVVIFQRPWEIPTCISCAQFARKRHNTIQRVFGTAMEKSFVLSDRKEQSVTAVLSKIAMMRAAQNPYEDHDPAAAAAAVAAGAGSVGYPGAEVVVGGGGGSGGLDDDVRGSNMSDWQQQRFRSSRPPSCMTGGRPVAEAVEGDVGAGPSSAGEAKAGTSPEALMGRQPGGSGGSGGGGGEIQEDAATGMSDVLPITKQRSGFNAGGGAGVGGSPALSSGVNFGLQLNVRFSVGSDGGGSGQRLFMLPPKSVAAASFGSGVAGSGADASGCRGRSGGAPFSMAPRPSIAMSSMEEPPIDEAEDWGGRVGTTKSSKVSVKVRTAHGGLHGCMAA